MQEASLENIANLNKIPAFEFETLCRKFAHYVYLGDNVALCRILSRYKIYVDIRDTGIAPHLIMDGFWETWLTQCLATIIKPGDVCIDAGANFGYYSVLMSALSGSSGRTVAIEPNPALCDLLRSTARIHNTYFDVAQLALSDKEGRLYLYIPDGFFGDASLLNRTDRGARKGVRTRVKTITLDALAQQLELTKVDVIKIDVEGAEPEVFSGMQRIISENPQLKIILEYSPFLYSDATGFTQYLFDQFTVHRIKDVAAMTTLDESAIPQLVGLTDHTDLYLERKATEPSL